MMEQQQQQQERAEAQSEQREHILRAVLNPDARERLKRIEQVRADRAQAVENHIISAVRAGKMQPPVSDDTVRELLTQIAGGEGGKGPSITVVRKRSDDDW